MISFSWRQFRPQAVVGLAGLVLVAIVLALTGPHLVSDYDTALAACQAAGTSGSNCNTPVSHFLNGLEIAIPLVLLAVPVLIGMFWGAPLIAHELEAGTFRLAWTQSVSRRRWLFVKLGLVGLASMLVAGGLSLMVTWWSAPIDRVDQNRFDPAAFGLHGFVPAGYAVFAFALGAVAGLVLRRTLPAMVVTLLGFIGARLAVTYWLRPRYLAPVITSLPLTQDNAGFSFTGSVGAPGVASVTAIGPHIPNALVTGAKVVDRSGQAPTSAYIEAHCSALITNGPPVGTLRGSAGGLLGAHKSVAVRAPAGTQNSLAQCFSTLSAKYREVVTYQPADRFWTFQTIETALFVVLALALAAGAAWWVRHRVR